MPKKTMVKPEPKKDKKATKKKSAKKKLTVIQMEIKSCNECSFSLSERKHTGDWFEMVYEMFCTHPKAPMKGKKNAFIGHQEGAFDTPEVPGWCPLRVEKK